MSTGAHYLPRLAHFAPPLSVSKTSFDVFVELCLWVCVADRAIPASISTPLDHYDSGVDMFPSWDVQVFKDAAPRFSWYLQRSLKYEMTPFLPGTLSPAASPMAPWVSPSSAEVTQGY